jgi:hypothetical protein
MTALAGIFELTSVPFVKQPLASLTVGGAFLATAVWLHRGRGIAAPAILGALFLLELSGEPFYQRRTATDWGLQASLALLSLTGLVAAVTLIKSRLRAHRAPLHTN